MREYITFVLEEEGATVVAVTSAAPLMLEKSISNRRSPGDFKHILPNPLS
jgi:hypothetical protein